MDTYDRADWHSGADKFPADLPAEAGGTHIGLFLAWAILRERIGDFHREESAAGLLAVRRREQTGRDFLFEDCDGKFSPDVLNDEGNAFARVYYQDGQGMIRPDGYLGDYERVLGGDRPDLYRVEDSWFNFDRIAPVIDRRFEEWKKRRGIFAPPGTGNNFWRIVGGGP